MQPDGLNFLYFYIEFSVVYDIMSICLCKDIGFKNQSLRKDSNPFDLFSILGYENIHKIFTIQFRTINLK